MLKDVPSNPRPKPDASAVTARPASDAADIGFEEPAIALLDVGLDGIVGRINPAARALFRVPPEAFADLADRSVRDVLDEPMQRLATGHLAFWSGTFEADRDRVVTARLQATLTRTTAGSPERVLAMLAPVGDRDAEEIRLPAFLDQLSTFVGLLDCDGRLLQVNEPALEIAGLSPGDVIGRRFADTYWWSYAPSVQARLREDIDRALNGETISYEATARIAGGKFLAIDFQLVPLRDAARRVVRLLASAVDISGRTEKESELAQTMDQLQMAVDVGRLGLCIFNFENRSLTVSPTFRASWGFEGDRAVPARAFVTRIHPDDRAKVRRAMRRMLFRGLEYDLVHRVVWENGQVRRVAMRGRLLGGGRERRAVWVTADITERAQAEDARMRARQREMVVSELGHRLNNLFPVVLSIAALLGEQHRTLPEYRTALESRLRSLWATHTLLTRGSSESATIAELVAIEARPFPSNRIRASGPAVNLSGGLAEGFAMIVHELATNAAKHGALSRSGGRVDVRWTMDADRILDFSWEERGGPRVAPPVRTGFGSSVIGACEQPPVCGEAEVTYRPEGLLYRLRLDTDG